MKVFRNIFLIFKLLNESFAFAFTSVRANKLRTFLSLLGVSIGIFAIISVYTMVDALEDNMRAGVETLGSNVVYIEKWPWGADESGEYKWWEFWQRPAVTYAEYQHIQSQGVNAQAVALYMGFRREVKYKNNTLAGVTVVGFTHEWNEVNPLSIAEGRYMSTMEANSGAPVAIVGHILAEELFGGENPIGKEFKAGGHKLQVIALLEKEGSSIVNVMDLDNIIAIPFNYARTMADMRWSDPSIAVKAKPGIDKDDLVGELKMLMRSLRRLKPAQKDNFALNEMSIIEKELSNLFVVLNLVGMVIGGFSILIGGFGIANIMFVSVKERTPIIGIQKALGAKGYFILAQFLFEASLLAVAGGLIGLLIVLGGSALVSHALDFTIQLSLRNVMLGISISAIIGLVSGLIPAYVASRLDPVVAINAK
ncbi:MAG: ABC transporter permease [Prevotellaceae bacterium]|jgi:putative ABC transport system permease protein|nr:ABC transporter permease [Prevotellaceae bacterium]